MLSSFIRSCPFKLNYSKISSVNPEFKTVTGKLFSQFQNDAKEILSSGSILGLLESFKVKLSSEKGLVPLSKLCTLNLIDAQKAEIHVIDQTFVKSIMSAIQGSENNLSISQLGTTKLAVQFPKPTAESKLAAQEQVKRRVESLKNEIRELRRKEINKFRSSCKDKDSIHRFENDIQNEFDAQIKALDALHTNLLRSK